MSRFDALEKQIAGKNALEQANTSTYVSHRQLGGGGGQGLIPDIISQSSPLADTSGLTVGGQVYGPDGSAYPSVTAAIQAGVFNFTYFPVTTGGIREGGSINREPGTGRRSFVQEAQAANQTDTSPLRRMFGGG